MTDLPEPINAFRTRLRWLRRKARPAPEPRQMVDPTPIYVSQRVRLIIILLAALTLFLLFRNLPVLLTTVLLGATLALILSFPVRFLQRYISRRASIAAVTISLLLGAVLSLALIIPFLINEITRFIEALPATTETITRLATDVLENAHERGWIDERPDDVIANLRGGLLETGQTIITSLLDDVLATLTSSVSMFISAFGVVFVAVYLLADIPKFHDSYLRLWAPAYRKDAEVLWETTGYSLSRYLGALVFSLFIQGTIAFLGLYLLGVPYALILGLVQTVTAILPYIGAFIAAIPAILMALTINWQTAVAVALLYLAINQIEGNLITPNLQGNAVKVHPILIFIGVIGGSQLFGVMGAVLAVPAIAIMRVIFEFFWIRLRVHQDIPTVLAVMRNDTAGERFVNQSSAEEQHLNVLEAADGRTPLKLE
jgi:predicted PurR-regulated permease PerM